MFKSDDLVQLRSELNEIDKELFILFIKRYKLCKQIGEVKKSLNIPIYQPQIYNDKLNRIIEKAQVENIPKDVIEKLYNTIHEICVDAQSIG
ncbi:MAG: chorismate mutase [Bacteroidales bacterium]|jgi:chorismate mutase|nr:chorismate mutase [Bacteroidales bacterium]